MTTLISEQYLKQHSTILNATESKFLQSGLEQAEKIYIKSALGSALFSEIKTQNNSGNLSPANQTLLNDYIADCLVFYTKALILPDIYVKIGNAGLMQMEDVNAKPVGLDILTYQVETAMNLAQNHAQRLIDYLKANRSLYPLYDQYGSSTDSIRPVDTLYDCGIYLGKEHCNRSGYDGYFNRQD
jgi:hypothetical protein